MLLLRMVFNVLCGRLCRHQWPFQMANIARKFMRISIKSTPISKKSDFPPFSFIRAIFLRIPFSVRTSNFARTENWNFISLLSFQIPNVYSIVVLLIKVALLYVEKDLAQCTKVMLDKWDTHKEKLNHQYYYVANCRLTAREYTTAIEKGILKNYSLTF